ncbi:uncharacterized protein LOC116347061 [Contarinia nasturtii]|uniref:uncharacterized protein LOC116347061 n=1 Tax=Contarinia nasturtii TaxID=265458 RepID=UPI0012D44B60|nr:uncharacterized protein LOC116347061 [Contarinia nasturtii]
MLLSRNLLVIALIVSVITLPIYANDKGKRKNKAKKEECPTSGGTQASGYDDVLTSLLMMQLGNQNDASLNTLQALTADMSDEQIAALEGLATQMAVNNILKEEEKKEKKQKKEKKNNRKK